MRLFIAVEPAADFLSTLVRLQDDLRGAGVTGTYLDPSNIHLTLAFIGERNDPSGAVPPPPKKPFPLTLSGLGVFREADVLWAGAAPSRELDELAEDVRAGLTACGVPFDPRPFVPHITLVRRPRFPEGFSVETFPVPAASMTVRESCLYLSARGEDGVLRYTVIGKSAVSGSAQGSCNRTEET